MEVFRITQEAYAMDLSGNGSRVYGGRWNNEGVYALYTSQSRSLALLENIVHTPVKMLREKKYLLLTLYIPDDGGLHQILGSEVPENWDAFDLQPKTRELANDFFHSQEKLILKVPSVLMPEEFNYVLNPLLPAMKDVKIIHARPLRFNDRLMQDFK